MTYISVRKERYSHKLNSESKEFVINLVSKDLVKAADYCGVRSGEKEDKFQKLGLHAEKAENVSAPVIKEAPVSIECRVEKVIELGTHDMFMAKILSVDVEEKYLDETGRFDMEKCIFTRTILYIRRKNKPIWILSWKEKITNNE